MSNEVTQIRSALESLYKQNQRKPLDANFHFVPLDLTTLSTSLSKALSLTEGSGFYVTTIQEFLDEIVTYVNTKFPVNIEIKGNTITATGASGKGSINDPTAEQIRDIYTPARVHNNGKLLGVLFVSYGSAKQELFTQFLNRKMSKFLTDNVNEFIRGENDGNLTFTETETQRARSKSEKTFNVGHIFGLTDAARTPLQVKIKALVNALGTLSPDGGSLSFEIDGVQRSFTLPTGKSLAGIKAGVDALYNNLKSQSKLGAEIEVNLDKQLKGFLSSINANIVIIQDSYENQKVYANLLEWPVWDRIQRLLATIDFSRNLVNEVVYAYTSTVQGMNIAKGSSTKKLAPIKIAKTSKTSLTVGSQKLKARVKNTVKPTNINAPSLLNLQNLINASLVERVKANMGTGNRRDVLNLRTGRFAESVKVERMSQSREGMITAFYSYMKNPYATFSQGGRQESPKSRDPKLLIAKSIREIATQQVANRLRSVSV